MGQARTGERRLVLVQGRQEQERAGQADHRTSTPTCDQFEYLADMIRQMQVLAWQTGCGALASILELAHREADQRRRALAAARRREPV